MIRRPFPPDHLPRLITAIGRDITESRHLNPPRRHRTYPRAVKRMRHNGYRVKRPYDTGIRHTRPPTIKTRPNTTTINLS